MPFHEGLLSLRALLLTRRPLPVAIQLQEPMLLRPEEQLLPATHIKFAEHVAEVMANGGGANEESAGNIFIGQTLTKECQHVRLTFGQDLGRARQDCAAV